MHAVNICHFYVKTLKKKELSRWCLLIFNWYFPRPLCTSVWFDFNERCYWSLSLRRTTWGTTEIWVEFTFPLEHVTDLIRLVIDKPGNEKYLRLQLSNWVLLERTSKMNGFALQKKIFHILELKYHNLGSISSDYVPIVSPEHFFIINR